MSQTMHDIPDQAMAISVMMSTAKSEPIVLMLVPRMERLEQGLAWLGRCEFRAKGVPSTPEGRNFMAVMLEYVAKELRNDGRSENF